MPNLLLIGPDTATRPYLDRLLASQSSVRSCDSAAPRLPSEPVGGLVVRDVERLTRNHQHQVLEWLNGPGFHTRIIATSVNSLYPLVERGEFSDALYYRINIVTLLLDESSASGAE
jgi:transcriptional regulator with GAF, ATPase, and Fis domain